jgi:hypothetical protein
MPARFPTRGPQKAASPERPVAAAPRGLPARLLDLDCSIAAALPGRSLKPRSDHSEPGGWCAIAAHAQR